MFSGSCSRCLAVASIFIAVLLCAYAAEPCSVIPGRAHLAGADGQLRIWQIGTHHEYEPDEPSSLKVKAWLESGVRAADRVGVEDPASSVYLFADFLVCPVEPFKQGSVQRTAIRSASGRRFIEVNERLWRLWGGSRGELLQSWRDIAECRDASVCPSRKPLRGTDSAYREGFARE